MRYYKLENGYRASLLPVLSGTEISKEEYDTAMSELHARIKSQTSNLSTLPQMTESEVLALLIPKQINTLDVDDNTALRMKSFYPTFVSIVGQTVKKGFKFTHGDKLWKTEQPELTVQAHYPPGIGTESLYSEVCETHSGTIDDPIPYSGNMALTAGLYYMQDWLIYLCTRDTVNPVYNPLKELVGIYVEKA